MTQSDSRALDHSVAPDNSRIILDGCVLLNLFASRRMADILESLPRPAAVADYVRTQEALWVGRHKNGLTTDCERVDIGPLIASGLIEVMTLQGDEELAHFLPLASSSRIDDGEAMSGALAITRGLTVATDDRAAIRLFSSQSPQIPTCSTASLVKHWAKSEVVDSASLAQALLDIRERASFEPSHRDPLRHWWLDKLRAR